MKRQTPTSFDDQEEIDAEKRALRVLLDSFHVEDEVELAKALQDKNVRHYIGQFIASRMVPVHKRKH